jgi:hypothetical protein
MNDDLFILKPANFGEWVTLELWSTMEAVFLLPGYEPVPVRKLKDWERIKPQKLRLACEKLYRRVKDAIHVGQIKHQGSRTGWIGDTMCAPEQYSRWFQLEQSTYFKNSFDLEIPRDLLSFLRSTESLPKSKDIVKNHPRTKKATQSKQMRVKERRKELELFIEKIYDAGKKGHRNWAIMKNPLRFTKIDVITCFLSLNPRFKKGVKPQSIIDNDLPHIQVKFAPGTRGGKIKELEKLLMMQK